MSKENLKHKFIVLDRVQLTNGFIAGGIVQEGPGGKQAAVGLRLVQDNKVIWWVDLGISETLAVITVLSAALNYLLEIHTLNELPDNGKKKRERRH